MIKRRRRTMPELNMASMPDLIFTVLFFFMISSHMRSSSPQMTLQTPEGTMLAEPQSKSALVYLYVTADTARIQVGNRMVNIADLPAAVSAERQKMTSADRKQMVVCMKADRRTPMAVVSRVKQALRDANATRIIYVAKEKKTKE